MVLKGLVDGEWREENLMTEGCGRAKLLTSWRPGSRIKGKQPERKKEAGDRMYSSKAYPRDLLPPVGPHLLNTHSAVKS